VPYPAAGPRTRRRAPTRGDLVVFGLLAAAVPASHRLGAAPDPSHVLLVRGDSGRERVLDARRDADVEVLGPLGRTLVRVRGGAAWIEQAPCPNRLCQRMGRLRGPGRSLVCVPNRVLVRFAAGAGPDVDTITR